MSSYQIDIDPNSGQFSQSFKDFFQNHFVNSYGLSRGDVDTSFFETMTEKEKEIAKRLIRNNLELRKVHLFKAAGQLKDELALPILYDLLGKNDDLSWLLTIGQAIWKINGDELYADLLRKLQGHLSGNMKEAHFEQVTDLRNSESIEMLFNYLDDKDDFVRHLALSKLNHLLTGASQAFDREYFKTQQMDKGFKQKLLLKLQNEPRR